MSDHIIAYLDAYHDGELNPRQVQSIESHLAVCPTCREAYLAIENLSAALQEYQTPKFPAADLIASQVALCLPREQAIPVRRKILKIGWWMIPVALLSAWVSLGITGLVNNLLMAAEQMRWLDPASVFVVPSFRFESFFSMFVNFLVSMLPTTMHWVPISENFIRPVLFNLFWHISIAILYLSWIAIWWTQQANQRSGQSINR
jgi:predicted anti-sigma-YlaC factor YlaD